MYSDMRVRVHVCVSKFVWIIDVIWASINQCIICLAPQTWARSDSFYDKAFPFHLQCFIKRCMKNEEITFGWNYTNKTWFIRNCFTLSWLRRSATTKTNFWEWRYSGEAIYIFMEECIQRIQYFLHNNVFFPIEFELIWIISQDVFFIS